MNVNLVAFGMTMLIIGGNGYCNGDRSDEHLEEELRTIVNALVGGPLFHMHGMDEAATFIHKSFKPRRRGPDRFRFQQRRLRMQHYRQYHRQKTFTRPSLSVIFKE